MLRNHRDLPKKIIDHELYNEGGFFPPYLCFLWSLYDDVYRLSLVSKEDLTFLKDAKVLIHNL